MGINKLAEYGERTTIPHGIGESADWYTLSAWPPSRDRLPRLMLAIHRMTGECHIDWAEVERAAADLTDQARHLARALLAIRDQATSDHAAHDKASALLQHSHA